MLVGRPELRRRGATLIEVAITIPAFLILILMVIDFGYAFYRRAILTRAVSAATEAYAVSVSQQSASCFFSAASAFVSVIDEFNMSRESAGEFTISYRYPWQRLSIGQGENRVDAQRLATAMIIGRVEAPMDCWSCGLLGLSGFSQNLRVSSVRPMEGQSEFIYGVRALKAQGGFAYNAMTFLPEDATSLDSCTVFRLDVFGDEMPGSILGDHYPVPFVSGRASQLSAERYYEWVYRVDSGATGNNDDYILFVEPKESNGTNQDDVKKQWDVSALLAP